MPSLRARLLAGIVASSICTPAVAADWGSEPWWDTDWDWRQRLVLGDAGNSSAVADVPVMIELDSSRIAYADTDDQGDDLRFVQEVDSEFTVLDYEIERWNESGTSTVWVRLPSAPSGASAGTIWMYYGNAAASAGDAGSDAWASVYKAVWHFEDLADSTANALDLTAVGTVPHVTGKVGRGRDFDSGGVEPTANYLTASTSVDTAFKPLLGNDNDAALEFWIQSTQTGSDNPYQAPGVTGVEKNGNSDDIFWGYLDADGDLGARTEDGSSVKANIKDGAWHHVVIRFSGDSSGDKMTIYMDGAQVAQADVDDVNGAQVPDFDDIGRIKNSSGPTLDGLLDEVRILGTDVGLDYAKVSFASQNDTWIAWCDSPETWYTDGDSDGFPGNTTVADCAQTQTYFPASTDCNDEVFALNPDTVWYVDGDRDGVGGATADPSPGPEDACTDPSDGTCDDTVPTGDCFTLTNNDCNDGLALAWDTCGTCLDSDADGAYVGCNVYNAKGQDCSDSNNKAWNTCGTCVDTDGDTYFTGCNQYPGSQVDLCDDSAADPIDRNNFGAGCTACADTDGDGAYVDCDLYATIPEDHCDDDGVPSSENAWTTGGCAACDDNDGDTRYSGCEAYLTVTRDFCDNDGEAISENNWTEFSCGACADTDSDGFFDNCDQYDAVDLPQDLCDVNDPVGQHHWTSACSDCADLDDDNFHANCDDYDLAFREDCADDVPEVNPDTVWYADGDSDGEGFGAPSGFLQCADPSTDCGVATPSACYAPNNADCDDSDATLNSETSWHKDTDGDDYGSDLPSDVRNQCAKPTAQGTWIREGGDCNDGNPAINPETVWYLDGDDDLAGSQDPDDETQACLQPTDHVATSGDCDDDDPALENIDSDGISWADENAAGSSDCLDDSDGDGVDDVDEWWADAEDNNSDDDGLLDIIDPDDDNDGIDTIDEVYDEDSALDEDHDGDDLPDYRDADDDGDSLPTLLEGDGDPDNDFIPAYLDDDDDNDNVPTLWELQVDANPHAKDSDGDGVADGTEWGSLSSEIPRDFDGDEIPDVLDSDDDNDGLTTLVESRADIDGDENCNVTGDGFPAYIDVDSDGDGICDNSYVPGEDDDCVFYATVTRGPNNEIVPENLTLDSDNDGLKNVYDCGDFDGGLGDADGDGLTTLEENAICTQDGANTVCLDPANPDTDGDGVRDGVEVGSNLALPVDTNSDGTPDWWDLDDDGDNVPTASEDYSDGLGGDADGDPTNDNTDGDSLPDYLDDDDDGDGLRTRDEDWNDNDDPTDDDIDGDLLADYRDEDHRDGPLGDADYDGLTNEIEQDWGSNPANPDSDGDGVLDGDEAYDAEDKRLDSDGDLTFDIEDEDDDDDGIPTAYEGARDVDGDAVPNHLDLDSDGDTLTDAAEGGDTFPELPDSDGDGLPDFLDAVDDHFDDGTDNPRNPDLTEPGCACDSTPSPGGVGGLALLLLVAVRRRRLTAGC